MPIKTVLIVIALLAAGGAATGYYLWNKPHRNVDAAQADFSVEASDLFAQYASDETAANPKYLDKIITVCGIVEGVTNEAGSVKVQLIGGGEMGAVSCEMETGSAFAPPQGSRVCLKGICTGYLMDVVLNRCVEVKPR